MTTPRTASDTAYRKFHQHLRRFLAKRLNNADEIEDVLQEVFVRVVRNEKALSEAKNPLAWLYTLTRSALIDHYRKKSTTPTIGAKELNADELALPENEPQEEPDVEFSKCLSPLVGMLPEKYKDAIAFTYLQDGKQTELAKQNNLNPSTAKSRVQRGRKMLKTAILDCCRVELDSKSNIVDLSPDGCKDKCC